MSTPASAANVAAARSAKSREAGIDFDGARWWPETAHSSPSSEPPNGSDLGRDYATPTFHPALNYATSELHRGNQKLHNRPFMQRRRSIIFQTQSYLTHSHSHNFHFSESDFHIFTYSSLNLVWCFAPSPYGPTSMSKLPRRYTESDFDIKVACIKPYEVWTAAEKRAWLVEQIGFRHFAAGNVVALENYRPKKRGMLHHAASYR